MRILVVEDHPKTAALFERGLRENFYDVDVAKTGEDAVRLEATNDFDAVVLDLTLPDIDGSEVLRRIRARGSTVPVLVVTAHGSDVHSALGRDAGSEHYLQKPFYVRRTADPPARPDSERDTPTGHFVSLVWWRQAIRAVSERHGPRAPRAGHSRDVSRLWDLVGVHLRRPGHVERATAASGP